ncbi:NAD-dependent epimerase/dehydratase family protein [Candidatus Micrarchaeota archaeon]|nr:NAD-dependent epimerase/dehydratase family protein [Candidatus Micrarchaeota archaeon]
MAFWEGKKVLVTGGGGFAGSHLVEALVEKGAEVTIADNLSNGSKKNLENCLDKISLIEGDLRELSNCVKATKNQEIVMNLVAKVGGIEYNRKRPGSMLYNNVLLEFNVLEAARINEVERFLAVSSACVYPRYCTIPTPEEEGFKDIPEPTNLGYGWSKRMAEVQAQTYAEEYGMKIAIVRPYNMYGPRDHFDPEKSHVIPALIKRLFDGENPFVVWGNGEQSRAFLYVTDAAEGMMLATEKYAVANPLNIGTEEETKIKDLVYLLVELSGKNPKVVFDASKPAGQPRRNADVRKAKEKIGYSPKVSLREGLTKTIEWYKKNFL